MTERKSLRLSTLARWADTQFLEAAQGLNGIFLWLNWNNYSPQ